MPESAAARRRRLEKATNRMDTALVRLAREHHLTVGEYLGCVAEIVARVGKGIDLGTGVGDRK